MLPTWLQYYVARASKKYGPIHLPIPALLMLLQEIGQFQSLRNFLLVEPPRSAVFHSGTGMYLLYPNMHRTLLSFEMRQFDRIHSIGLRYRDPLNPKSGVNQQILSGWMGMVRLLESAVSSSPFFGKLQTIETECRTLTHSNATYSDADVTYKSTYDIWVQARQSWGMTWEAGPLMGGFQGNFYRNQRVLLARVKVERPVAHGLPDLDVEIVRDVMLYPEHDDTTNRYLDTRYGGKMRYYIDYNGGPMPQYGHEEPLDFMRIDGTVMNLPPHSELQLSYK